MNESRKSKKVIPDRELCICPVCGMLGWKRIYSSGKTTYAHRSEQGMVNSVKKYCIEEAK